MDTESRTVLAALESGDTDRVNDAIEAVEDADTATKDRLLSECFDACRGLYEDSTDGYQRQAVVRFLQTADPGLGTGNVSGEHDLEPDDLALTEDSDEYRDALAEFYLTAIRDDDGRVRNAAIRAIRLLATRYAMLGEDVRLEALVSRLDDMAADATGKKRDHIVKARTDVQACLGPDGTGLRSALQSLVEETQIRDE